MRPVVTHNFRGKRYQIWGPPPKASGNGGLCDSPKNKAKSIRIPIHGKKMEDLYYIIHESTHACLWDIDEDSVEGTAWATAYLLWRLGWRKI